MKANELTTLNRMLDGQIVLLEDSNLIVNNLVSGLSSQESLTSLASGGWCSLEVVCHLRDFETIFQRRIEQLLEDDYPLLFSRTQDAEAAARLTYREQDLAKVLGELNLARAQTISNLKNINPKALSNLGKHKVYGELSLLDVIVGIGRHDVNHIKQISNILKQSNAV